MPTVAKQLTSIAAGKAEFSGKCPAASGQTVVSSIIHLSESQRVESASEESGQPGSDPRLLVNIFQRIKPVAKKWITEVEHADIKDHAVYFIALRPASRSASHMFSACGLNGKTCWSEKPGIAKRYEGGEALREHMRQRNDCIAVQVPADADTRWRARREKR